MNDGISVERRCVGVDLHLHRSVIAGLDEVGSQLGWVRIDNDPAVLVREVRNAGGRGCPVAIEATYGWYWAVDALAAGFVVHLAHPLGMKALRKRKRVKTDPADAYELANLLRLGSLPEAYIAPPDLRELRELVRHRRQLVKLATAVKAGIRALLAKHNIRLSVTQLESDTATGLLDALALPGTYAVRLASQRRLMLVLADEIAAVEVDLHARLRNHPGYRNLLTVKGIGPVLAANVRRRDRRRHPVPDRRRAVLLGRAHAAALRVGQDGAPRPHQQRGRPAGPVGCGRGGPAPVRAHGQSRQGRDRGPPREGRPQHRQGRRRAADARGRLLRTARRPSPLPHDGRRGMSITRTSCRPGNAMTHPPVRSTN